MAKGKKDIFGGSKGPGVFPSEVRHVNVEDGLQGFGGNMDDTMEGIQEQMTEDRRALKKQNIPHKY